MAHGYLRSLQGQSIFCAQIQHALCVRMPGVMGWVALVVQFIGGSLISGALFRGSAFQAQSSITRQYDFGSSLRMQQAMRGECGEALQGKERDEMVRSQ